MNISTSVSLFLLVFVAIAVKRQAKLEVDLKDFAEEYHQRVLRGLAPAAVDGGGLGGEGGRGGGGQDKEDPVTVLPDGTIDVTPREKPVNS